MLRSVGIVICGILCSAVSMAQSVALIDQISKSLFESKHWSDLYQLTSKHTHHSDSLPALMYRGAVAAYELEKFHQSEKWLNLILQANSDYSVNHLLHWSLRMTGAAAQAILIKKNSEYKKYNWLGKIGLEGGIKHSELANPGNLQSFGLAMHSRLGYRLHLKNQISRSTQPYFWENFQLISFTSKADYYIDRFWSLKVAYQLADYTSTINYSERSTSPGFVAQGAASQILNSYTGSLNFRSPFWTVGLGFSHFNGNGNSVYTASNFPNEPAFTQTYQTNQSFFQNQFFVNAQYVFPFGKEKLQLGFQLNSISYEKKLHWQVIPELNYKLNSKLYLYCQYWKKGPYLMALPESGLFINNPLLLHQRLMIGSGYFLNSHHRIDLNYIYEWGNDELYNQKLILHGFFLNFSHLFQL